MGIKEKDLKGLKIAADELEGDRIVVYINRNDYSINIDEAE